ncbi:TPA: transcriptional repressor [Candidatus Saccharibacteria bacterium]|nr:transcriptional repressor [Candidatus Saccharibacteria bacterium]HIO87532.1 transcriptional repressor [Candidatus Saccharibacteria bacterium]
MSAEHTHKFKKLLTSKGYRVTQARLETFKLLHKPEPQTIKSILEAAQGTVDKVSVYRNLDLFEKLGLIHRVQIGWKYKLELSDEFLDHHHHLSCLKCGRVIDIEDEKHIEHFIAEVSKHYGFVAKQHQFEVSGYCRECKYL